MRCSRMLATIGSTVVLAAALTGWSGGAASRSTSAVAAAPREMLTAQDAERILGDPVSVNTTATVKVPELPGCPAYAKAAQKADQRVAYSSDTAQLWELALADGADTQNLEDFRDCSTHVAKDGTVIDVRFVSAPGGPGNVDGAITIADLEVWMQARVVDGDNVEVIVTGVDEKAADKAMALAVARYRGIP